MTLVLGPLFLIAWLTITKMVVSTTGLWAACVVFFAVFITAFLQHRKEEQNGALLWQSDDAPLMGKWKQTMTLSVGFALATICYTCSYPGAKKLGWLLGLGLIALTGAVLKLGLERRGTKYQED